MIKIFEDDSYIKFEDSSQTPGAVTISICARDSNSPNQVIMLSVEMKTKEFFNMMADFKKEMRQ